MTATFDIEERHAGLVDRVAELEGELQRLSEGIKRLEWALGASVDLGRETTIVELNKRVECAERRIEQVARGASMHVELFALLEKRIAKIEKY